MTQMGRFLCGQAVAVALLLTASVSEAQLLYADGVKTLAAQIDASVKRESKRRIGVVSFTELDGRTTMFGRLLSEDLTTQLVGLNTFEVIERALLDKVFAELKLTSTGVIDPATASRIGQLAGVDALVTGSIAELPSSVAVNCRLIEVQKGRVFAAASTRITKDDDVKAILGKTSSAPAGAPSTSTSSTSSTTPTTATSSASPSAATAAPAAISTTAQGIQFDVDSCARRGGSVTCKLWITNLRDDRGFKITNGIGTVRVSFWDNQGNEFQASRVMVANQRMTALGIKLLSGIRTLAVFDIEGHVPGTMLSRIAFSVGASDVGFFQVVLKEIPIQ